MKLWSVKWLKRFGGITLQSSETKLWSVRRLERFGRIAFRNISGGLYVECFCGVAVDAGQKYHKSGFIISAINGRIFPCVADFLWSIKMMRGSDWV